jgi:hypothetical protein
MAGYTRSLHQEIDIWTKRYIFTVLNKDWRKEKQGKEKEG